VFASAGIFFGPGNQNQYIKVVVNRQQGTNNPAVHDVREVNGDGFVVGQVVNTAITDATCVDLYLEINPANNTYVPSYALDGGTPATIGGTAGSRTIPSGWLTAPELAVGIIATSEGGSPEYVATWDLLEVTAP
jgi:hypothetical protein